MSKTIEIANIAAAASIYWMQPGDVVNSPRGEPMHRQPKLLASGIEAGVFMLKGGAVGVVVIGDGRCELRYFDREGIVHTEQMGSDSVAACMARAVARMCELIGKFLGERHPLADAASANARAA